MKHLRYILRALLFLLLLPLSGNSQSNTAYYYYYKGEKVFLEADTKTIALSAEGENSPAILKSLVSNGNALSPITEDYTRSTLVVIDQQAANRKAVKTYYAEITTAPSANQTEYSKQIEAYRNMLGIIMASPCFQMKDGKKMGLSNNFYVKLKGKEGVDFLYETAKRLSIEVLGHNQFMPLWFTLSCGKATKFNALEAANLFYETGAFESTEPAFMLYDLLSSSDTYFTDQWGLKNIGQAGGHIGVDIKAEQAWTITTGSSTIKTAIFDEGLEMNHPDLQANVSGTGYDIATSSSPSQVHGPHGTACAGIVGAVQNNNLGVSGVAPGSKLMSVSIYFSSSLTYGLLANGINWAWQNGADVISNSWGGGTPSSVFDNAITNALIYGRAGKGTVIVFSSGNNNSATSNYPGNSNPLILNVGAIDRCGVRSGRIDIIPQSCDPWCAGCDPGSAYGTTLDVVGLGSTISTTDRQGSNGFNTNGFGEYANLDYTRNFGGTSAACPHVAGVAALVLSANSNLTVQQVNDIIEQTAQKTRTDLYSYITASGRPNGTWNNQMGYGLVNAYQAVVVAANTACPANLTITTNVTAPNADYKQASGTITALNIVNSGATAIYHAGNEVMLSPGFAAVNGSSFKAYIEGCTGNYQLRLHAPEPETITYAFRSGDIGSTGTKPVLSTNTLLVSPNPFTNKLTISYYLAADNKKTGIEVYSITGVKVADLLQDQQTASGTHNIKWNAHGLSAGVYLIVLTTDTGKEVKRVVKK